MYNLVSLRAEDANLQVGCVFVMGGRSYVLNAIFSDLGIWLFHGDAAVLDLPVVDMAEEQWRDVFAVGIEDHVARDDLKLAAEICVAGFELLLNHYGVSKAAGSVAKFPHSEPAVPVIDPQKCDTLYTEFGVDVTRECVALDAVVLNDRVEPGNDRLRDRWVRGRRKPRYVI